MITKRIFSILFALTLFLAAGHVDAVEAAKLYFDPTSVNVKVGETFKLTVKIDVGTSEVLGADVLIDYDKELFKATVITDGTFISLGTKDLDEPGKVAVSGYVDNSGESVTGSGAFMDVTFEALKGGTGTMTFDCELGESDESNISESSADATDLIECSQNGEAVVVVSGGTSGGATGTAGGGSGGSSGGSTASSLPQTGFVENMVIMSVIIGGVLVLIGVGTRYFA